MANRIALHTDESYQDNAGFWVIAAEEGTGGYSRINVWPTLEEAQRYAEEVNDRIGITADDRHNILASSIGR